MPAQSMTPSLPRSPQIGSRQVVETLRKLAAEVGGLKAFEPDVREAIGNTNWTVLMQRLDEADAALSRTAQAPVADGVREAAQILLSEIDSATDMDCVLAASSALRTALASSPAMLAAAPSPSSSGTGWRPIETAPHGVEVLLATPPFKCMGEQARWEMRVGCASFGERIGGFSNRSRDAYATHWLPLPSAPVSDGGAE